MESIQEVILSDRKNKQIPEPINPIISMHMRKLQSFRRDRWYGFIPTFLFFFILYHNTALIIDQKLPDTLQLYELGNSTPSAAETIPSVSVLKFPLSHISTHHKALC
jgi:hypothetical protein